MYLFFIAFMQSITGFGLVIIATPLLMMIYDAKQVVLIVQLASILINAIICISTFRYADKKLILLFFSGALLGQPFGLYLYDYFSNGGMRIGISFLIIFFIILTHVYKQSIKETPLRSIGVGYISGLCNACTGIGGPPLVLYLAQSTREPKTIRATTVLFFCMINVAMVIRFYFAGKDLSFAASQTIYAMPAAIMGLILGHIAFKHISPPLFKRILFAMLLLASIYTIYETLIT